MKRVRLAIATATIALGATGCALLFDFGHYDISEPLHEAGDEPEIIDTGAPFHITDVSPNPAEWPAGETFAVHVSVQRAPGFLDPIGLTATGLPAGISVVSGAVESDASAGDLLLAASTSAEPGRLFHGATVIANTANGVADQRSLDIELTGAPGALDNTFGDAGVVFLPFFVNGAALDPDNAIVLAVKVTDAGAGLARFSSSGSLDTAFGEGGIAIPILGAAFGSNVVEDDAGYVMTYIAFGGPGPRDLLRVDRNGEQIQTYGEGGIVQFSGSGFATAAGPANQTVVAVDALVLKSFTVHWVTEQGVPAGVPLTQAGGGFAFVEADGEVLTVATGLHLTRVTLDGSIDPTFIDPADAAGLPGAQPSQVIAVPGAYVIAGDLAPYGLAKVLRNGTLDPTFGVGGLSTEPATLIAPADGGAVYLARGVAVGRLTASGANDPVFSASADQSDTPVRLLVQKSGRIVVVGQQTIHRYWP